MQPSARSSTPSAAASDLARRLIGQAVPEHDADDARVAAAERLFAAILSGLSRWFGADGSRALVTRALATARRDHPALAEVRLPASGPMTGFASVASIGGASAVTDGLVTMIAALADLLGRLIGDDLAIGVLEQCATSSARLPDSVPSSVKES